MNAIPDLLNQNLCRQSLVVTRQRVREVANRPYIQGFALTIYVQDFHGKNSKMFLNTHKRRPKSK